MTPKEAINILKLHNDWRKGANIEMQKSSRITEAIDVVVNLFGKLKTKRNDNPITTIPSK